MSSATSDPLNPYTGPIHLDSWPLPAALPLDQALRELTEFAGYDVDDDDFDIVIGDSLDLVQAWITAASSYASRTYLLHLLVRPIAWHRDEIAPPADHAIEDLKPWVKTLAGCLTAYENHAKERRDAYTRLQNACHALHRLGMLHRIERQWQPITLIPHGLTATATVEVPADATAPWPLVKVDEATLDRMAATDHCPAPGQPVVRRIAHGYARLDHHGHATHLLSDPDGRYWLRDFSWINPQQADAAADDIAPVDA